MIRNGWRWMPLAAFLVSVPVLAQECPCGRGPGGPGGGRGRGFPGGPGGFWGACLASPEVGLTPEQRARLEALRVSGREQAIGRREAIRSLREELHEALLDPRASPQEIRARAEALHEAMDRAREEMLDRLLEARAVLSSDQIARLRGLPACQGPRFRGPPEDLSEP